MKTGSIEIKKKARYSSYGSVNAPELVFVLHGYGQLSEYFIRNFESLNPECYLVIAPEGTHRFYLNGTSGRVGASWMTKEWREQDLEENFSYLESLLEYFCSERNYEKIHLLGFSQGGATAARFFARSRFKIDRLLLWACVFPEDATQDFDSERFIKTEKFFVLGNADEYFKGDDFRVMNDFYKSKNFQLINYVGGHKIDLNPLHLLFQVKA